MNCHDFEMTVLALARDQQLETVVREQSLAHAAECVRCADRLAEEQALMASVRAVVEDIAEEETPARVEAALFAAFREQVAPSVGTTGAVIPITIGHLSRRWLMAAAMILVLVSATTILRLYSRSQIHAALTISSMPVKVPALESKAIKDELAIDSPHPTLHPQNRVRHRSSVPAHRLNESEEVTEFFPLMEGGDPNSQEVLQVVRIELSSPVLMDVGMRVSPGMTGKAIKADVILGQDGLARAIRFVR